MRPLSAAGSLIRLAANPYLWYVSDNKTRGTPMKTFIIACIAAAVIAVGAVVVLNGVQKPVDVAFTTSAVRI
jgi:hypothetical protein